MQEVYILPLKKPGLRHLSRLSKKSNALRGNHSECSQGRRKPANERYPAVNSTFFSEDKILLPLLGTQGQDVHLSLY